MGRAMEWTLGVGLGLIAAAYYFSILPYTIYAKSEFWLNSPAMVLIKLGAVLAMLAAAYLWVNLGAALKWSVFRQLGTTSLLVYWIHIEIVYGRWFGIWKEGLPVAKVLLFTALLLALMIVLSVMRTRIKSVGAFFGPSTAPQPRSAPAD
jgi:fucose 4-O-acetylase-like acetyltransferase